MRIFQHFSATLKILSHADILTLYYGSLFKMPLLHFQADFEDFHWIDLFWCCAPRYWYFSFHFVISLPHREIFIGPIVISRFHLQQNTAASSKLYNTAAVITTVNAGCFYYARRMRSCVPLRWYIIEKVTPLVIDGVFLFITENIFTLFLYFDDDWFRYYWWALHDIQKRRLAFSSRMCITYDISLERFTISLYFVYKGITSSRSSLLHSLSHM